MGTRRRAREKAAPGFIPELDPEDSNQPPAGPGWVHEVKWDGFRAQAHLRKGKVTTYSRSGLDWTSEFDTVSEAVSKLKATSAVLDGEVIVIETVASQTFRTFGASSVSTPRSFDITHSTSSN